MAAQKLSLIHEWRQNFADFLWAERDALAMRVFECTFTASFLAWMGYCLYYWREWLTVAGFHLTAEELASMGYPEPWPLLQPAMVLLFALAILVFSLLFMLNQWRRVSAMALFCCALYAQRVDFMMAFTLNKLFVGVFAIIALAPAMSRNVVSGRWMQSVAPMRVIQATLILQYFAAGMGKMDADWLKSGDVLWGQVQGVYRTELAAWALRNFPAWAWTVQQYLALALEVGAPLLFTIRQLRPLALLLGLGFHLVIALMMKDLIFFSAQMWTFYALFITVDEWRRLGAKAFEMWKWMRGRFCNKGKMLAASGEPSILAIRDMNPASGKEEGFAVNIARSSKLPRRLFLTAAGVTLALPLVESVSERLLRGRKGVGSRPGAKSNQPMRLVCVGNAFGFYQPSFWPKETGRGYDLTPLLRPLAAHQEDMTLFSGLDHGQKGGHWAVSSFLSGVRSIDAKWLPDRNLTIDQRAAESIGGATRFPSLTVGSEGGLLGGCLMSWTRSGNRVPPIPGPKELFHKLFVSDSAQQRDHTRDQFELQGSILDAVRGNAKSLERQLGRRDVEKLDEYFTSVREVEKQLELSKRWTDVAKPTPGMAEPEDTGFVSDLPVLYDLIALALQSDSTRIATLEIAGGFEAAAFGLRSDYHRLSHHGQVQEHIDGLAKIETYQMEQFARFLGKLKATKDGDGSLLDHTMVLFGSGMANANAHTNLNLPIILSGGGFKHGEHRGYSMSGPNKQPLCNLYVTMLQRFGLEVDKFGNGHSRLSGFA
jgi:hypothetical protein